MLACMRVERREDIFHRIQHFLPCIGLPSYTRRINEWVELEKEIIEKLKTFTNIEEGGIFLFGKTRTDFTSVGRTSIRRTRTKRIRELDGLVWDEEQNEAEESEDDIDLDELSCGDSDIDDEQNRFVVTEDPEEVELKLEKRVLKAARGSANS